MIPSWLHEKLASPPPAGAGIHAWLFSVARQLHAHMEPAEIESALRDATAGCERRVTAREIRNAENNSRAVAWQPKDFRDESAGRAVNCAEMDQTSQFRSGGRCQMPSHARHAPAPSTWPALDADARRCRLADAAADGVTGLVDLWERSPGDSWRTADDWLDWLFPGAEWLCLATDHPATARSRLREKWMFGPAEQCGLVVPSPMTGPSGKGLDGRVSHRCLGNTGPRRWLVIEFDSGTIDEQAQLHWHLRAAAIAAGWPRLRLCVHSGGKSLHGWFGPTESNFTSGGVERHAACLREGNAKIPRMGKSPSESPSSGTRLPPAGNSFEEAARDLVGYAVSLGADPATWNRCQLVRLPGGVRKGRKRVAALPEGWIECDWMVRQEVFFFEPSYESPNCPQNPPHTLPKRLDTPG